MSSPTNLLEGNGWTVGPKTTALGGGRWHTSALGSSDAHYDAISTNVKPAVATSENTVFCVGVPVTPEADAKSSAFSVWVRYTDSAGKHNWPGVGCKPTPAGTTTYISGKVIVPAGMTVDQVGVAPQTGAPAATIEAPPVLSIGSPVVRASDVQTVTDLTDVDHVAMWWLRTTSATTPSAPASESAATSAGWAKTEPGYDSSSTSWLWTVMETVYSDGTVEFGPVSKSSSYEAAKEAWNKASSAQQTANDAAKQANNYLLTQVSATGGKAAWVKLGTVKTGGDSHQQVIVLKSGNGWNAGTSQNSTMTITIKDGFQSSKSAKNACVATAMCENWVSPVVKVLAQAHDTYDVWVYMPWSYWGGYCSVSGVYESWVYSGASQASATATTNPPAEDSTHVAQPVAYRLADATDAQNKANGAIGTSQTLYYSTASTTPPAKPTAQVTSTSTTARNAWTTAMPVYSASYPLLYTCRQLRTQAGTYSWTSVVSGSYANFAKEASDTAKTLAGYVREVNTNANGADGLLVGYSGVPTGALVNADGSFDVRKVTWHGDTPTVGAIIARFGNDQYIFGSQTDSNLVYTEAAMNNSIGNARVTKLWSGDSTGDVTFTKSWSKSSATFQRFLLVGYNNDGVYGSATVLVPYSINLATTTYNVGISIPSLLSTGVIDKYASYTLSYAGLKRLYGWERYGNGGTAQLATAIHLTGVYLLGQGA